MFVELFERFLTLGSPTRIGLCVGASETHPRDLRIWPLA